VNELHKIVARETDAFDPLILSVTGIQGGGAYNIIADRTTLRGTIRSGSTATRERAHRRLHEIGVAIAQAHGATAEITLIRGEPPVVNDADMTRLITDTAKHLLGPITSSKPPAGPPPTISASTARNARLCISAWVCGTRRKAPPTRCTTRNSESTKMR